MASSEKLASMEPWMFRPTFASDSWFFESSNRDTELLTRVLQKSFSDVNYQTLPIDYSPHPSTEAVRPAPALSNASGSEPDSLTGQRKRRAVPVSCGKVSKRKSRATKRSQTTFITADPANFREMVQQVTGVRFGGAKGQFSQILKPEPQRIFGSRLSLPLVDANSFLSNHHQETLSNVTASHGCLSIVSNPFSTGPNTAPAGIGSNGLDYDPCQSIFPTLESWKVDVMERQPRIS